MLDTLMGQLVTLRRPKLGSRSVSGKAEYDYVLAADETQVKVRCRIELRGRRTIDTRGAEIRTDAQMLYRQTGQPVVLIEDVVVTKDGRAWRVVAVDEQQMLFGGTTYGRIDLVKTEMPVKLDKDSNVS